MRTTKGGKPMLSFSSMGDHAEQSIEHPDRSPTPKTLFFPSMGQGSPAKQAMKARADELSAKKGSLSFPSFQTPTARLEQLKRDESTIKRLVTKRLYDLEQRYIADFGPISRTSWNSKAFNAECRRLGYLDDLLGPLKSGDAGADDLGDEINDENE